MKKILLGLLVIVSVIFLTGCNQKEKETKNPLVGSWSHGSYTYTFNEDGTGKYSYDSRFMEFTYEDKGNEVEILYHGNTNSNTFEYKIEGKKLIIKDSFDNDVEYIKK